MGTTDPQLRIFAAGIIRRITATSNQAWATAQKIGLVRASNRGRELYCLEDAYRLALSQDLRSFGLDAREIATLVPAILEVDFALEGSWTCVWDTFLVRLMVDAQGIAASVDEALAHLSVTLAAEPLEEAVV